MLTDYIQKKRTLLEKHIDTFLTKKETETPKELTTMIETIKHLRSIVPKGKLLRGIQIILANEMLGGNVDDSLNAAAAIEIIQAAVLIHDDFMDNDYTRRGARSIFAQYMDSGKGKSAVNPLLYGQSIATCIGDIGFFFAFELINKSSTNAAIAQKIVDLFSREWQLVGAGQMMDVDFSGRPYDPTEEEILTIYKYKTARYSFSLPLMIGAILASADEVTIQKLNEFGEALGIVFQIKDDELGLFGDEKATGKPVGSDIRENKKTLYRSMLFQNASSEEKHELQKIFGNQVTSKELSYIKGLIQKYSIQDNLDYQIKKMHVKISSALQELSIEEQYTSLLKELVDFVTKRSA